MIDPDERDLRRTGEEAERLLQELEETFIPGPPAVPPPVRPRPRDRPRRRRGGSSCLLTLLSVGAAVVGLLYIAPWLSDFLDEAAATLPYSDSCGSGSSARGEWWPVLGPADPELLATVRRRYCGDAFIDANGSLQVASFSTPGAAEAFARRLSRATGVPFRVGGSFFP